MVATLIIIIIITDVFVSFRFHYKMFLVTLQIYAIIIIIRLSSSYCHYYYYYNYYYYLCDKLVFVSAVFVGLNASNIKLSLPLPPSY